MSHPNAVDRLYQEGTVLAHCSVKRPVTLTLSVLPLKKLMQWELGTERNLCEKVDLHIIFSIMKIITKVINVSPSSLFWNINGLSDILQKECITIYYIKTKQI